MKKNITINLCGSLYAIDEDACEVLEQYLRNMERYFGRRDGGDEIVDDIEHRVAELFSDLKAQGVEAINVGHVHDIIRRIGNPEEMDESPAGETASPGQPAFGHEASSAGHSRVKSWFANRRLFRDPDDKVIGGVISGLSKFFGSNDPLPWRIIFILLLCFSFSIVGILYLIAWAFIPEAATSEDRLKMRGRPVNPETLNEELMHGAVRADGNLRSDGLRSGVRGFFGSLFFIIGWCIRFFALFVIGALLLFSVVVACMLLYVCISSPEAVVASGMVDDEIVRAFQLAPALLWMVWGALLSGLLLLGILFYVLVRSLLRRPTDQPMRSATRVTLLVLAVLGFASCLTLSVLYAVHFERVERELYTQNGVYFPDEARRLLAEIGWKVTQANGCNNDGDYVDGSRDFSVAGEWLRCLKFERDDRVMQWSFASERTVELPMGDYHLEALAHVGGPGAKIFLVQGEDSLFTAVPYPDDKGNGNIAYMDSAALASIAILPMPPGHAQGIDELRDKAKEWSWVRSATFRHPGGTITYGFTGNMCSPASEAELYRIEAVPEKKTKE